MDYLVISDNHTFMVCEFSGEILQNDKPNGLYYRDTRYLSLLHMSLAGQSLDVLSHDDDTTYQANIILTNRRFEDEDGTRIPAGTLTVSRSYAVHGSLSQRLVLQNFNNFQVRTVLAMDLAADFMDMFEVRGIASGQRGELLDPHIEGNTVVLTYLGQDGVTRKLYIFFAISPSRVRTQESGGTHVVRAEWDVDLTPQGTMDIEMIFEPVESEPVEVRRHAHEGAKVYNLILRRQRHETESWLDGSTKFFTDNVDLNNLIERSTLDIKALTGEYPTGRAIHAGIPWFAVPFGRDSIITSMQTLPLNPDLAIATLRFLAKYQGKEDDPWRDEEPGKIMHEMRFGELANRKLIPHTPYYGSVDATPLFVMLFAQVVRWTGDRALYSELLPSVMRALEWIDRWGDLDGDGFLEYKTRSELGIRNQGWKDSQDSILYPDGSLVSPPIALVEVQAYAYAAKLWLSQLAAEMGDQELANRLASEAANLKEAFNKHFWVPDASFFAQGLDDRKVPIKDITSNPGHALMCDIVDAELLPAFVHRLMQPDMLSGWGIRTRSLHDPNFNPVSYHNGSVWPHDNSLIIYGLYKNGFRDEANEVSYQILEASRYFRLNRLPELMCGFQRDEDNLRRPAEYPVSCSPQAWAAGTVFMMLRSMLGIEADGLNHTLRLSPSLPAWIESIEVSNLRVAHERVHFAVSRDGEVEVISRGDITILVE